MAVTTLDQTHTQREREVANALASLRMEGLEPSDEARGIFQQYANGELTLKEMGRAVDQLAERQYGLVTFTPERSHLGDRIMAVITETKPKISAAEVERRRNAVRRAAAHNRIEGQFPSQAGKQIFDAFIRGEIDQNEILPRLHALHHHL